MTKRLVQSLVVTVFLLVIFQVAVFTNTKVTYEAESPFGGSMNVITDISKLEIEDNDSVIVATYIPMPTVEDSELYSQYLKMGFSPEKFYEDLELLEAITIAEAGNQSELGKRLVIDTVLNRIDSDRWRDDDTIWEVIAHPYQFETYTNGAYMRVDSDESVAVLIEQELLNRTNYDVIYFKTGGYFSGVPAVLQEGDHWFSGEGD